MKAAFTLDDLPSWPHGDYPAGYSSESIADALMAALEQNGMKGVYAFSNSLPLLERPETKTILDRWVAAGHHVGNHTHGHANLNDVSADDYIDQIDLADRHLAPWLDQAPGRFFRYTLNMWGDTEDKRRKVKAHLDALEYRIAEVTTFFYEWRFNAAYETCLARGDQDGLAYLKGAFIDYAIAQLHYDMDQAARLFDAPVKGITLGHNVPFFADVAADLFAALIDAGLEFIPFEEAADEAVYDRAASGICNKFLVYQQKLAFLDGEPLARLAPECVDTHDRVADLARGRH
jgi:peptidoglycan/xylan/chitin deacetylase (PgdA/CDA1 family)